MKTKYLLVGLILLLPSLIPTANAALNLNTADDAVQFTLFNGLTSTPINVYNNDFVIFNDKVYSLATYHKSGLDYNVILNEFEITSSPPINPLQVTRNEIFNIPVNHESGVWGSTTTSRLTVYDGVMYAVYTDSSLGDVEVIGYDEQLNIVENLKFNSQGLGISNPSILFSDNKTIISFTKFNLNEPIAGGFYNRTVGACAIGEGCVDYSLSIPPYTYGTISGYQRINNIDEGYIFGFKTVSGITCPQSLNTTLTFTNQELCFHSFRVNPDLTLQTAAPYQKVEGLKSMIYNETFYSIGSQILSLTVDNPSQPEFRVHTTYNIEGLQDTIANIIKYQNYPTSLGDPLTVNSLNNHVDRFVDKNNFDLLTFTTSLTIIRDEVGDLVKTTRLEIPNMGGECSGFDGGKGGINGIPYPNEQYWVLVYDPNINNNPAGCVAGIERFIPDAIPVEYNEVILRDADGNPIDPSELFKGDIIGHISMSGFKADKLQNYGEDPDPEPENKNSPEYWSWFYRNQENPRPERSDVDYDTSDILNILGQEAAIPSVYTAVVTYAPDVYNTSKVKVINPRSGALVYETDLCIGNTYGEVKGEQSYKQYFYRSEHYIRCNYNGEYVQNQQGGVTRYYSGEAQKDVICYAGLQEMVTQGLDVTFSSHGGESNQYNHKCIYYPECGGHCAKYTGYDSQNRRMIYVTEIDWNQGFTLLVNEDKRYYNVLSRENPSHGYNLYTFNGGIDEPLNEGVVMYYPDMRVTLSIPPETNECLFKVKNGIDSIINCNMSNNNQAFDLIRQQPIQNGQTLSPDQTATMVTGWKIGNTTLNEIIDTSKIMDSHIGWGDSMLYEKKEGGDVIHFFDFIRAKGVATPYTAYRGSIPVNELFGVDELISKRGEKMIWDAGVDYYYIAYQDRLVLIPHHVSDGVEFGYGYTNSCTPVPQEEFDCHINDEPKLFKVFDDDITAISNPDRYSSIVTTEKKLYQSLPPSAAAFVLERLEANVEYSLIVQEFINHGSDIQQLYIDDIELEWEQEGVFIDGITPIRGIDGETPIPASSDRTFIGLMMDMVSLSGIGGTDAVFVGLVLWVIVCLIITALMYKLGSSIYMILTVLFLVMIVFVFTNILPLWGVLLYFIFMGVYLILRKYRYN